jgi:hypothetical protein
MAKLIVVSLADKQYSFSPIKVDRAKIYGVKKRVALDSQGRFCTRAILSTDGSNLILPGMTAQGYFKMNGQMIERKELIGIDSNGNIVPQIPSTLGISQVLEGPVESSEILGLDVESIYFLEPIEDYGELMIKLKAGEIYKFQINFTTGLEMEMGYLIANDEGCFAIVGKSVQTQWIESATLFESVEASEDADDLDFESM